MPMYNPMGIIARGKLSMIEIDILRSSPSIFEGLDVQFMPRLPAAVSWGIVR